MISAGHFYRRVSRSCPAALAGLFPIVFIPVSVDAYILPRVLVLLAGAAAGLCLALAARRGRLLAPLGPMVWPCLAVLAAALLALVFSINPWLSLAGSYLRYESFPVRAGYVLLFGVTALLLEDEIDRRRVVTWLLLGCAISSLEAVWEWYAFANGLIWGLDRPDGNLGNAGLLGGLTAMAMPLALWRVLDGGWRWPLWLLVMLVLAAGLLVSTERAGWLAALVASAVVVLARVPRAWRVPSAAAFVLAGAGAAALVLGPLGQLHSDPLGVRTQLWALTVPMIEARPLLGWGEDTFGLAFAPYAHGYLPGVVFDRAHSQVLDLLAAQGVAGLAANAWFWGALAWGVRSRWPREESPALTAALLAYAIWAVVNFDWVPVTGPAWLLAGVVWSIGVGYSPPSQERAGHAAPLRLTAAVIATVAAIAFGVLPIIADNAYYRGDARLAVTLDPIQARYHSALAENLEAGGDAQGAAAERRRATELGG